MIVSLFVLLRYCSILRALPPLLLAPNLRYVIADSLIRIPRLSCPRALEFTDLVILGLLEYRILGLTGSRILAFLTFSDPRILRYLGLQILGFSDSWVFGFSDYRILGIQLESEGLSSILWSLRFSLLAIWYPGL